MRGIYGQAEGNERRNDAEVFADRIFCENHIAEGEHVAALRRLVTARKWDAVTNYTDGLRQAGHGLTRVQSMLTRAMAGLPL
jgi:hypothetical protein